MGLDLDIDAIRERRRRFVADAIDQRGAKSLALELDRMGFHYEVGTIRSWKASKTPPGDALLALSAITGLSFEQYLTGEALEARFADRFAALERQVVEQGEKLGTLQAVQRTLVAWATEDDRYTEMITRPEADPQQVAAS